MTAGLMRGSEAYGAYGADERATIRSAEIDRADGGRG